MLGSAKFSCLAGHSALYGDRFSMVRGARASLKKGSKSQYYPLKPPENDKYNPGRPFTDLNDLPIRKESHYWEIIVKLQNAETKSARNIITRESGISRMPLCVASHAFMHPSFFPLDPFHLFYENCMAFMWDLWNTLSVVSDPIHLSVDKGRLLGELIPKAMETLPAAFCGTVRDPFLKRQSQYKIYEWMALLHWYIIPIGLEIGMNARVLSNFSYFVNAIEFAMTIKPRSNQDLLELHSMIVKFLEGYEILYVNNKPENVSRSRLCIFQMIYVPMHIEWYGSVRLGSQATCERAIGEMGSQVRSKKAPFKNLSNLLHEREDLKLLLLYTPSLRFTKPVRQNKMVFQEISVRKKDRQPNTLIYEELEAICDFLGKDFDPGLDITRWGKHSLPDGNTLRSQVSELKADNISRSARYFEAVGDKNQQPVFGEALAFFKINHIGTFLATFYPIVELELVFGKWRGKWSKTIKVLPIAAIKCLIGIWCYDDRVYVLQKHPGLEMLSAVDPEHDIDLDEESEFE
ncbi:hypothetical protein BV25DRAFT_1816860 [Artomyces pyxidatus]|uniref:Uncharacterized protein n=1 Tax=Artomyces pyxidatus TaxID=48021 RepID=A0ACB8SE42_9AGAM|nr:hypothetical protein BV25DRAFT_1816860 [Artomyces pyxidatus]